MINEPPPGLAKRDGVFWAELRRSPTRLRSHELRRGRLAILSGRSLGEGRSYPQFRQVGI